MKKILFLLLVSFSVVNIGAQEYAMTAPIGWGTGTTGGGAKTPVTVSTESALRSAIKSNSVVIIDKSFTLNSTIKPNGISNLTILGRNGATLTCKAGGLVFESCSNIIVRNIKLVGPGAETNQGDDPLNLNNTTKVWIDHCEIVDGSDGNFDIRSAANYIAVTWCKFSYTSKSALHEFSNLIGSSDSDTGDRGKLKVTFQYCWWAQGCVERMPRIRFGQVHLVNNLYNSAASNYCARAGLEADLYIDKNAFVGVRSPLTNNESQTFNSTFTTDNLLSNVLGTNTKVKIDALGGRKGEATWNPYTTTNYTISTIPASQVQSAVSNASCGAGATLTVAANGSISTPCSLPPSLATSAATWVLTQNMNATVSANLNAGAIQYSGTTTDNTPTTIGTRFFIAEGTYPAGACDPALYVQFSVAPKTGYDFFLDEISFLIYGNGTDKMRADFYYSTDPAFTNRTQIMQYVGADLPRDTNGNPGTVSLTGLNLNVAEGKTIYLRIYPYHTGIDQNNGRRIILKDVKFAGATSPAGTSTSLDNNAADKISCYKSGNRIYISGLEGKNDIQVFTFMGQTLLSTTIENDFFSTEINSSPLIVRISSLDTRKTKVVKLF